MSETVEVNSIDERVKRLDENVNTMMALMHGLAQRVGLELEVSEVEGGMDAKWVPKRVKASTSGIVIL